MRENHSALEFFQFFNFFQFQKYFFVYFDIFTPQKRSPVLRYDSFGSKLTTERHNKIYCLSICFSVFFFFLISKATVALKLFGDVAMVAIDDLFFMYEL